MAPKTTRNDLADMLEDLSNENFDRFCHYLLDRREEPRVKRCKVKNKSRQEVSDVLVSTFTEPKSGQVAVEILRQIGCNEEAKRLESKTKPSGDNSDPVFRRTADGKLKINPSDEALKYAAGKWPLRACRHGDPPVKKPAEVEAEAKARVLSEGGDPDNNRLILSRCAIQFGKYNGQTFKWLLENDVGYVSYIVASHQEEREETENQSPLMVNKDFLTRYAIAYLVVLKEVRFQRDYNRTKGQGGNARVGFGRYRSMSLQKLYDSKKKDIISYVNFLRDKKSTCDQGSRMEDAIKYILQRDRRKAAARKRKTKNKKVQSTRGQSTSTSRPLNRKLKKSWRKRP